MHPGKMHCALCTLTLHSILLSWNQVILKCRATKSKLRKIVALGRQFSSGGGGGREGVETLFGKILVAHFELSIAL